MVKFLDHLTGMFRPDRNDVADVTPPAQSPRMLVGATAAPELCMIACEPRGDNGFDPLPTDAPRVYQLKADGLNAMCAEGAVISGREGTPLNCALHCQPGLRRIEQALGAATVFFGEYVAHDGFNATLAEHKRGYGDGAFWLYDAIPHWAWVTGKEYLVPIEQRLETLRRAFLGTDVGPFVGYLDSWTLTPAQATAKAAEIWAAGFEGMVSKEAGSGFARRRDDRWLKVKQRFVVPCPVVDTIHRDGKLRSIIVRSDKQMGGKPITLTGGWSAGEAETIDIGMAEGSEGRIVKVGFELTTGTTRSIRSPKFKGIAA